ISQTLQAISYSPVRRGASTVWAMRARSLLFTGMSVIGGALAASALKRPALPEVSPLPENFAWGLAMAGCQSEGHSPDSNWARDGAVCAVTIALPIGDRGAI